MFLPLSTDAPIYHFPWATLGLIFGMTILFFTTDPIHADRWMALQHGDGLSPVQWVTSMLSHFDFWHLLFNMIFLWAFGLVVEGKIGWWKFLLIFFAVGITQCALEEIIFLFLANGISLGASSAIYGILVIAMIWAPENDMEGILFLGLPRPMSIPIKWLAVLYLAFDFLDFALSGFRLSSGLLHIMGAAIGAPVGIWMLKRQFVDCEGWDLFSRLNRHKKVAGASSTASGNTTDPAPSPKSAVDWGWDNMK